MHRLATVHARDNQPTNQPTNQRPTTNDVTNRVIDKWNNLDQDTVDAPSLNSFKNRLNKIISTRMGFFMD